MGLTCDVGDSNHVMFWHDKFKVLYPEFFGRVLHF